MDTSVADLASVARIFDRQRKEHPWEAAFTELDKDPEITRRCVTANWRMDHRVSRVREDDLLTFSGWEGPAQATEWFSKLRLYFDRCLCRPAESLPGGNLSATLEPQNLANEIAPLTVPAHEQLVHAAGLNQILRFLQTGGAPAAVGRLKLDFRDLTGLPFPERSRAGGPAGANLREQVDEIAKALNTCGEDAVRNFAGALSDALQPTEPLWWATFAQEVQPFVEAGNGLGLCQVLGLGHLREGDWLILWRYEVGDLAARTPHGQPALYRPTVAEAVDNPFHFPSPPGYRFGITMPLASAPSAYREVLHRPLVGRLAAQRCTGVLVRVDTAPVGDHAKIPSLRRRHRSRLEQQLPLGDTQAWLGRHPAPKLDTAAR